jgi:hypothetical protein
MVISRDAAAYWLHCVYKFHTVIDGIPGYNHPISPSRAGAMHLIPFYNFWWIFKWPKEIAAFVNWRTQSQMMNGSVAGLLALLGLVVTRVIDGFVGLLILFGTTVYISRRIAKAFDAPPVPESAMAPPGIHGPLGL